MSFIRAMLLLCITILLSVGTFIFSNYTKDRFEIVPLKDGVFIFDRQTTASNFCNNNKCVVLSSEFLIPKKVLVAEIPGVVTKTQIQVQNPTAQAPAPIPVIQNNPIAAPPVQPQINPGFNQQMAQNQNNQNNSEATPDQSQQNEMNGDGSQNEQQNNDQQNFDQQNNDQQNFDNGQNDNQGNDDGQNQGNDQPQN